MIDKNVMTICHKKFGQSVFVDGVREDLPIVINHDFIFGISINSAGSDIDIIAIGNDEIVNQLANSISHSNRAAVIGNNNARRGSAVPHRKGSRNRNLGIFEWLILVLFLTQMTIKIF